MMQTVTDAAGQTMILAALLAVALLIFLRPSKEPLGFSVKVTSELKGFAILTILFGHIGYFLFADHNFLYPLSTVSGVGVDIFFLLSGYGLAISALKKSYRPWEFYKRRIGKIFVPLWIVLVLLLVMDAVLLRQFYDWTVVVRSFLGLFPSADIYKDLNSPLWYLTPLLFFYLIFPWVFRPRWAVLLALAMGLIGFLILLLPLPITDGVRNLYSLHYLAFPLGVALAGLKLNLEELGTKILNWMRTRRILTIVRYVFLLILGWVFVYAATAGGEHLVAQLWSVLAALAVLVIFICLRWRFYLLEFLGNYSYEIYLLHWPLLYRFDFIYKFLPAGVGTAVYIIFLLGLGYLLKLIVERFKTSDKKVAV